mgnify:CR=1 FL=1
MYVASFSGGKDSTAMIDLILEHKIPLDRIVCFMSDWEHTFLPDWIGECQERWKFKIDILRPDRPFTYYAFLHEYTNKKGVHRKGYGFPSYSFRWCTALKISEVRKYLNALPGSQHFQYIGICDDEDKRVNNRLKKNNVLYPLRMFHLKQKDALKYCLTRGYDFKGHYDHFSRLSCSFCPFKSNRELQQAAKFYPHEMKILKNINALSDPEKIYKHSKPFSYYVNKLNL